MLKGDDVYIGTRHFIVTDVFFVIDELKVFVKMKEITTRKS